MCMTALKICWLYSILSACARCARGALSVKSIKMSRVWVLVGSNHSGYIIG